MSDEAHVHFGGYVNKQNCRIWGSENPEPLKPDRTLLEHGFLPGCKRSCSRFLEMDPAPDFIRS